MEEKNTIDKIKQFWESKNSATKKGMIFSVALLITLLGALFYLYNRDTYEFLLSTSDSTVSANVINQLKSEGVKYDVKGESIYVSGVNADALKLELSGQGYLDSTSSNIDLFSSPLFISEKQENTLIQKDLESNIAAAIKSYNEVADAKVILTLGQQSSFKNDNVASSAAIQVKLKTNLSSKQVKSIQEFVAAAVPNLSSTDVVITDTNNNLLSSNSDNTSIEDSTAYTKSVEDKISSQVSELLSSAFPNTKFTVISRVDVNFDQTKIEKETVSSGPDTIVSHETHTDKTYESTNGSTAGTESNVPGYETPNNENNILSESTSEIINYELNTTKEQITKQPEITKINVAVTADTALSAVDTEKIRELVETASGYDEKRGDKVSVQSFDTASEEEEKEGFLAFVNNNFDSIANKGLIFIIIIAILIIVLKILSIFKKETVITETTVVSTPDEETVVLSDSEESENENPEVKIQSKEPEFSKKKEILEKEMEENPQQVATVFKAWLDNEK